MAELKRRPDLSTAELQSAESYESRAAAVPNEFRRLFEGPKTLCNLYLQTEGMEAPTPLYGKFIIGAKTIAQFNPDVLKPDQYELRTADGEDVTLNPFTNTDYSCVEFRERDNHDVEP
jgi:hypothetical protein